MSNGKTLVELICEKTGVSAEQAQQAIDIVTNFLKEKLPEPVAGQIDVLLKGDVSVIAAQLEAAKDMLSDLFGGKKE